MKIKLLLLTLICLISSVAQATTPKSIIVFGDSFTDSGNLYYLSGEPSENPWFTNGRIGDGPNWADYLAEYYKHVPPMKASSYGGTNYAIGGADSSFGPGVWGLGSTGLQVTQYLSETTAIRGEGHILYTYWVGGNDILAMQELSGTINNISIQLQMLIDAGAKHFLIGNMIPIGLTPDGLAGGGGFNPYGISSAELNSLSASYNEALMELLNEIKCNHPSVYFYFQDNHQLLLDVLSDHLSYGFENITEPVTWYGGDPEVSLWWDGVHATSKYQALIAERSFNVIRHHKGGLRCMFADE